MLGIMFFPWKSSLGLYLSCNRPRRVRLYGHAAAWIEDLRNAWLDRLDAATTFSLHVVQPRPRQFQVERSVCHILLEQSRDGQQAAVVLTALLEGFTSDGIIQGAFSMPIRVNLPLIIRTMEVTHFCVGRHCSLMSDRHLIPQDDWVDIWSGRSLRLRIDQPRADQSDLEVEQLHFEDLSLMQKPEASVFHSEGSAGEFSLLQQRVQLATAKEKTRSSPGQFDYTATSESLHLIVWFLDDTQQACRAPRCQKVASTTCFAKTAESLWGDMLKGRHCQCFPVTTMKRCKPECPELDEICFFSHCPR